MLIKKRKGKKKGKTGVTVSVYEQYKKPRIQKSLTVHNMTVDQTFEKIKFFLKAIEKGKIVAILIEGENNGKSQHSERREEVQNTNEGLEQRGH